jgi:hypothetical protein
MKDITLRFVHRFVVALHDGIISQAVIESAKRSATTRRSRRRREETSIPSSF